MVYAHLHVALKPWTSGLCFKNVVYLYKCKFTFIIYASSQVARVILYDHNTLIVEANVIAIIN
jgi:hypothetical protein